MSTCKPVLAVLLAASVAASPAPLLAQTQKPVPPTFAVGTSAVALDVVVRDKKGRIVKDLTQADFEVLEDGAKQQVETFSVIARGAEAEPEPETPAAAPTAPAPPAAPARPPRPTSEADVPSVMAVVFDRMGAEGRDLAHKAALTYLGARREGDYVGVFSIDLALHTVQNFTSDTDRIRQALDIAQVQVATGFTSSRDESIRLQDLQNRAQDAQNQVSQAGGPGGAAAGSAGAALAAGAASERDMAQITASMARSFETLERDQQGYATSNGLLAVVNGMARLPGRKTIVFFSEGMAIPVRVQAQFQSVVHAANRANVAIYTMDAAGLRTKSPTEETRREMMAANEKRFRSLGREDDLGIMTRDAERNEDLLRLNPQAGLGQLADQTGGFLIRDTNDARSGFRQISQDMRFHYVLGYTPSNQEYDGRFRTVTVKVRRPGFEVHSRRGYFAVKPGGSSPLLPYETRAVALLDRGGPTPQAFPLQAVGLVFPRKETVSQVPVLVQVPGRAVKYAADPTQKDVQTADLAIVVRVRNEYQQEVSRLSQHFQLSAPTAKLAEAQSGDILFYREADLPPGRYTLEAIAYDATATAASLRSFPLEVPAPGSSGTALSSLVLIDRIEKVPSSERDPRNPLYYGDALVYPNMGEPFHKSAVKALGFYFTARNAGQKALLEVAKSGQIIGSLPLDLPAPNADGLIQNAGALPLFGFAPGVYELRLSLMSGTQRLASRTAAFTVAE
jgi:VWFA-related protein